MSDLAMTVPPGIKTFMELIITPRMTGNWKRRFGGRKLVLANSAIKTLSACLINTRRGWGWSYRFQRRSAEDYAPNTRLNGAIILPSVTVPETSFHATIDAHKQIQFFSVVPSMVEEMDIKLRKGTDHLLDPV